MTDEVFPVSKPPEFPARDEEFDLDAFHRLHKLELTIRRYGATPDRLVARANLEFTVGNLDEAERTVAVLRETYHPDHAARADLPLAAWPDPALCSLCREAEYLTKTIADERKRPLRDRKDYSGAWRRGA